MHIKTTAVPKTERELIDLKLFVDDKDRILRNLA